MPETLTAKSTLAAALVLGLLTFIAYAPGLHGPFLADDHPNITQNEALKITELSAERLLAAANSGRAGPLKRPVSMLSFALNHAYAGLSAQAFKLTNLIIHLLTGLLLSRLIFLLTSRIFWRQGSPSHHSLVALIVTAVWLLHPIQLTNVLYVVQRMNSLCGLFSIAALVCYVSSRFLSTGQVTNPRPSSILGVLLLTALAVLSKENGVLVPGFILTIELSAACVRAKEQNSRQIDRWLGPSFATFLISTPILYFYFLADLSAMYAGRDFTPPQRLLTEARALLWYLKLIAVPDITAMGLIHDDWEVSQSLWAPPSTALSIAGLSAILALAWCVRHSLPVAFFGTLWFMTGHALESSVIPLALVFEHRNYLPILGAIYPAALLFTRLRLPRKKPALLIVALIVISSLFALTRARANTWSDDTTWIQNEARNHPNSASAQFLQGTLFAQFAEFIPDPGQKIELIARAEDAFSKAITANTREAAPLIARTYHRGRLGLPIEQDDLTHAAQLVGNGPVSVPTQNTVLTYCHQIRRGTTPALGQIQLALFDALLLNRQVNTYTKSKLRDCIRELPLSNNAGHP